MGHEMYHAYYRQAFHPSACAVYSNLVAFRHLRDSLLIDGRSEKGLHSHSKGVNHTRLLLGEWHDEYAAIPPSLWKLDIRGMHARDEGK